MTYNPLDAMKKLMYFKNANIDAQLGKTDDYYSSSGFHMGFLNINNGNMIQDIQGKLNLHLNAILKQLQILTIFTIFKIKCQLIPSPNITLFGYTFRIYTSPTSLQPLLTPL
jgi:hypothetical protein